MTTKIHTLTDAQGRPLRFILTGGETHDSTTAADLIAGRTTNGVIADKAYDSNALRQLIGNAGAEAVIPSTRSRKILIPHDRLAYRLRNRIERVIGHLVGGDAKRIGSLADRVVVVVDALLHTPVVPVLV